MPWYIHVVILFALLLLASLVRDHGRDGQVWPTLLAAGVFTFTAIMWVYMAVHW